MQKTRIAWSLLSADICHATIKVRFTVQVFKATPQTTQTHRTDNTSQSVICSCDENKKITCID
ncbi:MAG: hypothetical protein OEZ58_04085 [Gammaproteobacteria bacterium]|nr:hypothetical protein [Gammaproteobacteria bacterium]